MKSVLSAESSVTLKRLPEGPKCNRPGVRNHHRRSVSSRPRDKLAVSDKREGGLTGGAGERPDEAIKANLKEETEKPSSV